MAFDSQTRNKLQRMVGACRRLLADEFDDQLQGLYGIYAQDGRVLDLEKLTSLGDDQHQTATLLRDRINHLTSGMVSEKQPLAEAVRRVLREQAFTVLNRFAALRMAEERGFTQECVGQGLKSKGFQVFETVARSGLGGAYERYVTFIHGMFDELSLDLGVLFDRWSPFGLLFPREPALLKFFDLLNDPELKPLWKEDETIGWIYQYFNDEAERKKMREESSAPRNSRELAVRNQFFTPRYVVEFLTDNTLGRIWYEMTQGNTKLKEQCRYLVRRPNEIFLKTGDKAPEQPKQDNLSQEDLLKQPVHIPHRPLKDPRTILMLDPACGSMHFGLYAFDLFEVIYEEAWELEKHGAEFQSRPPGMLSLQETYGTKEDFLKDVPRLIIEHNLHGIDIDPRCAQIAGLSLWLRAQKAWQRLGLKPAERPVIKRSNIVCAEPMPGEKELLREFVEREFPAEECGVCLRLLETIFEKMQLAGEAGSLLKIEEEIRTAIEDARQQWKTARQRPEFFDADQLATLDKRAGAQQELPAAERAALDADFRSLTSEDFWERIEERIYTALRDYAEQAENGGGFQRRLFAEDAARGFAFIDLCSKRYDVALMNPPFGDASLPSKPYLDETYGDTKGDVYKAFVECFQARLQPASMLGIISSRTGFFLGQSEDWRTRVVLRLFRPLALADLGMGVLDAMVEVAAYVLRNLSAHEARDLTLSLVPVLNKVVLDGQQRFSLPKWQTARDNLKRHQAVAELEHLETHNFIERCPGDIVRYTPLWQAVKTVSAPPEPVFPSFVCVRALAEEDKGAVLAAAVARDTDPQKFVCDPAGFAAMPGSPFAYWSSTSVRTLGQRLPHYEPVVGSVKVGVQTDDDFRFVRAWWEVICRRETDSTSAEWTPFLKGDSASPFHDDIATVLSWANEGRELKQFVTQVLNGGHWSRHVFNSEFYFRPGISWALRTARFAPSCVPKGCIPSVSRYLAVSDRYSTLAVVGLWNSSIHDALCKLRMERHGHPKFIVGVVKATPFPLLSSEDEIRLEELSRSAWSSKRGLAAAHSTSHAFVLPALLATASSTLADRAEVWAARVRTSEKSVAGIRAEIDELAFRLYGLEAADRAALTTALSADSTDDIPVDIGESEDEGVTTADATALTADLLAYALGCAVGRWDIRYATGEQAAPELPDPFAPLPVCPPGQLQNAKGLPARTEDVPAAYPVRIPWEGILVDDPNHPLDIERRVREVIEIIWAGSPGSPTAEAIEHEACEILGVKLLRDYFRKPAGFIADHLKRYSKSRRQAPIYWPLSTTSGRYTLWVYYHRLTDQTLFQCVNDFVKPKLQDEVRPDIEKLRGAIQREGGGTKDQREKLEELEDLAIELQEFHDELLRVAGLPYKPNLNDGVLITASPLWKLFRLPKWQKDLKACWEELEGEEYEWAHLAYTIWPDRVKKVCKSDRSIAIAHGLEDLCEVKAPEKKAKRGKKKTEQMELEEGSA